MLELLEQMTINPARLYHMPYGTISEGAAADFVIFDPDEKWVPCEYASKSSNTPFTGMVPIFHQDQDVYKRQI